MFSRPAIRLRPGRSCKHVRSAKNEALRFVESNQQLKYNLPQIIAFELPPHLCGGYYSIDNTMADPQILFNIMMLYRPFAFVLPLLLFITIKQPFPKTTL
jgi:hypothetical protein